MATIKTVEREIFTLEGFAVIIRYEQTGRDVRADRERLPGYRYERAAPERYTVAEWIEKRFKKRFPGFAATVYRANGAKAGGGTKLKSLRATSA